ncbi:MAG TPA: CPBP family intramembrane glutamic endopeptidase [Anaerolineae bacterium]|nr:CPBP family intramembrane glutamic endopeptidase [Anaerolineae bacterium]
MRRFALALALLVLSAYVWPRAARESLGSNGTFLLTLCVGLFGLLLLIWQFRRNRGSQAAPGSTRFVSLLWRGVPVILLQLLSSVAYWAAFIESPLHLGQFSALPLYLLGLWILVDSGIRGVVEEMVFRGMLQPALMRRYEAYAGATWIAITFTTFWFLVAHIYGLGYTKFIPYIGFISLCYGYLVAQTRTVVSSAILHVGHNTGALTIAASGFTPTLSALLAEHSIAPAVKMMVVGGLLLANVWAIRWFARQSTPERVLSTSKP